MTRATTHPLTGTQFYVLLALVDADRYGLDIVQDIESRTGGQVQLGPGALYTSIKKMMRSGSISEVEGPGGPADDPRRRYYRITSSGRALLAAETQRLDQLLRIARDKGALATGAQS